VFHTYRKRLGARWTKDLARLIGDPYLAIHTSLVRNVISLYIRCEEVRVTKRLNTTEKSRSALLVIEQPLMAHTSESVPNIDMLPLPHVDLI
jgi:hypothetical protein